jgi:hypothetical protein
VHLGNVVCTPQNAVEQPETTTREAVVALY